jgi:hypothetical protein
MMGDRDKQFLRLLLRSPDHGDGWRMVSDVCWQLVEDFQSPELIEIDKIGKRIRLTENGKLVASYIV